MDTADLIRKIKEKKEISGISDFLVESELQKYFKSNKINPESLTPKDSKLVIKELRDKLRKMVGRFHITDKLESNVLTHSSTRERIEFYPDLKKLIGELEVKSILDLGCGLNPIVLADRNMEYYYASDINLSDLDEVSTFFNESNIKGKTFFYDLRELKDPLPKVDLCILFKVLDIIEPKGHKLAEKILNFINTKYFLISFSTKTLSGKPMNHPQRGWIEKLLNRLNFKFRQFKSRNEIFYLAEKSA